MAKSNKRVAGPQLVTNAAATIYTVPANTKAVIRKIHVVNTSASAVPFFASIGADAAATRIADGLSVPADDYIDIDGPFTLEETEILQAYGGTTNVLAVTVDADVHTL